MSIEKIVTIKRKYFLDECIIGKVYINRKFFCYSLEKPWKNNEPCISCIPEGVYNTKKHSGEKYKNVPLIENVKDRSYILFHIGNSASDTKGCILLGNEYDKEKQIIKNSKFTFNKFIDTVGFNFKLKIRKDKMGLSILALAAPFAKKIGVKVTQKMAKKLLKKVEEKTGVSISNEEEQKKAIEAMEVLPKEDLKEIKLATIEADQNIILEEFKSGEDLSQTDKDDWTLYGTMAYLFIFTLLFIGIILFDRNAADIFYKGIVELFESYFGLSFLLVCISSVGLRHVALRAVESFFGRFRKYK